jgi:polysaccharide export outer membrane protein
MKYISCVALILVIFSACSTKKFIYLREEIREPGDSCFYPADKPGYLVQPGDVLYISIHSTLSETKGMFHFPGQENVTSSGMREENMYLNQSVVAEDGYIRMPVIGSVYVAGSTIDDIEKLIETEARKYVTDALARVKLVSYSISFIGEFNNPGKINFYKDHVHILDAVAEAGDVTYYGDRQHIRVLRQTSEGFYTYMIDLTDKNLMTSNNFYLQPNDVVYAEPLPRKILRLNVGDYSVILASLTSTLALITVIISLRK